MDVRESVVLQHFPSVTVLSWQRAFGIHDKNKENVRKTWFEHVNSSRIPLACDHSNSNRQDSHFVSSLFSCIIFQVECVKAWNPTWTLATFFFFKKRGKKIKRGEKKRPIHKYLAKQPIANCIMPVKSCVFKVSAPEVLSETKARSLQILEASSDLALQLQIWNICAVSPP